MQTKTCEFCGNKIKVKRITTRFCDSKCQRKHYNQRPEIKEKNRITTRKYRIAHPEWKERHRILAVTRHREKRAKYWKDYGKRSEVRARINEKDRIRRKTDKKYAIIDRLRRSLNHAFTKYTKTGKIMSSKKYGIDWNKVIKGLEPFPKDIKKFEIDHKIPLHSFDLNKHEEIKRAFDPSNLQWLTMEENRRKGGKIMKKEKILEVL